MSENHKIDTILATVGTAQAFCLFGIITYIRGTFPWVVACPTLVSYILFVLTRKWKIWQENPVFWYVLFFAGSISLYEFFRAGNIKLLATLIMWIPLSMITFWLFAVVFLGALFVPVLIVGVLKKK